MPQNPPPTNNNDLHQKNIIMYPSSTQQQFNQISHLNLPEEPNINIPRISNVIKLNHNNDAEYTGPFRIRDENLNRYMHEMEILWMHSYVANDNDPYWKPYKSYFINQMTRWNLKTGEGGCEAFSKGHKDFTWCMNTKGEYVFCQLCNDPKTNPNPNCERSEECEHCEFKNYDDCHVCPDMIMSKECHYKKAYIRAVLRMKEYCKIVDSLKNMIPQQQSCNCKKC